MKLKEWLIEYITKNPNVNFGSIYRDACYSKDIGFNSHDGSLFLTIKELLSEGSIIEIGKENNTYFNLGTQLNRDRIIDELI